MSLRRTLRFPSICLVLACLAMPAAADYRTSYKKAISAIDEGDWNEAARWLERAIDEQPEAGGPRILMYGSRWVNYTPYHYLARAYVRAGREAEVCDLIETSIRQGKVQGDAARKLASLHADTRSICEVDDPPDLARALKKIQDGSTLVTQVRNKMEGSDFAAIEKRSPPWLDPLKKQLDEFPGLAPRLDGAKTQAEIDAVARDADRGIKTLRAGLKRIDSDIAGAEFEDAFAVAERSIKKAREKDRLSSARTNKLETDADLKQRWNATGSKLADADAKMKQSFDDKNLARVKEADRIAQQVLRDRNTLLQSIDAIKVTSIDPLLAEIAKRERRSDELIRQAADFVSPSSELRTQHLALDQARQDHPGKGANRGILTAYWNTLKTRNDALAAELAKEPNRQEIATELRDILESTLEARRLLEASAGVSSPPAELVECTRDLEAILADKVPDNTESRSAVTGYHKRLQQATAALNEAFPAVAVVEGVVPLELRNAFAAYSQGRYAEVETALVGVRFDGDRANLQINLFRAAARFARYVRGGETDKSLLEQVHSAVRECRRIQSDYQPGELFSPRFRELYRDS